MRRAQKTKVVINGVDVSRDCLGAVLPRDFDGVEQVILTMAVSHLHVNHDGVLIIRIETEE